MVTEYYVRVAASCVYMYGTLLQGDMNKQQQQCQARLGVACTFTGSCWQHAVGIWKSQQQDALRRVLACSTYHTVVG